MSGNSHSYLLIVDDDPGVRESLEAALGPTYTISAAATSAEALACFAERVPDGVILDVRLGDEDGLALLPLFRQRGAVRVLVLTAYGDKATVLRAFRAGALDCLDKPFGVATLQQAVAAMVGRPVTDAAARVKAFIEAHYKESLTLPSLAHLAELGERQLQRRFSERYSCSPCQYLLWVRIQAAQRLRGDQHLPLRAIASQVGFADPRYLARLLRKVRRGVWPPAPPGELRPSDTPRMS